jgi:hypothetical protein
MPYQNSAIKGAALTLPSIEAGLGTMNILRDPPKSIHTRYKPKVSDTSKITEWIDDSGDRVCEAIKPYARGVNPMVSVSYSNYGTNGGQYRDGSGRIGTGQNPIASSAGQSYLPYRTARDGAFRPPIIPPEQLLPLSRLPRLKTSQVSNPGSKSMTMDFAKLSKCSTDLKSLRKDLLRVCAAPKAIFNIETPLSKPYEVDNMINIDKRKVSATANKNNNAFYTLGINKDPERGIKTEKNTLYGSIPINISKNIQGTPLHGFSGNQKISIQDRVKGNVSTNSSGRENHQYIHQEVHRERRRPITSMQINAGQLGVDMNQNINSRSAHLPERVARGGFQNTGFQPNNARVDQNVNFKRPSKC